MKKLTIIPILLLLLSTCSIDQGCLVKLNDFDVEAYCAIHRSDDEFDTIYLGDTTDSEPDTLYIAGRPIDTLLELHILTSDVLVYKKYKNRGCYSISITNPIKSLTIKTLYDYSDEFPAGSDVTALFKPGHYRQFPPGPMEDLSIEEFLDFISRNHGHLQFSLYLMDDTSNGGVQKFEITLVLSDGVELIKQTEDLLLCDEVSD